MIYNRILSENSKKYFFSIGIPVYNAEKYLNDCIDSILSQSFTDFELILVDDGSTDNSLSICQSYAEKDSRVKVFHYENGGISVASNHILDECTGEYIFMMDNDDTMCENILLNIYDFIINNNHPDLVRTNSYMVKPDGTAIAREYAKSDDKFYNMSKDERTMYMFFNNLMSNPTWVKFIKASLIYENNIRFNERYSGAQDADFSLKVCRCADTICFTDHYSVNWFHPRSGSVSSEYKLHTLLKRFNYFYDYMVDFKNWDMSEEYIKKSELKYLDAIRDISKFGLNMNRKESKLYAETIENAVGKSFRKLDNIGGFYGTVFRLYNIIGIKNTVFIVNTLLRLKGVID